jgi:hypothetical protein
MRLYGTAVAATSDPTRRSTPGTSSAGMRGISQYLPFTRRPDLAAQSREAHVQTRELRKPRSDVEDALTVMAKQEVGRALALR